MNNNFKIIKATENDIPLILFFIKQLAEYVNHLDMVVATEDILIKELFGDKSIANVVIAYQEEKAVGFALYFKNFSTFLGKSGIYLEDLFVLPEYRGKGYGKALLMYLIELAYNNGCGRLEWSVLDWNKPAIDFYKNIGAKAMDESTVYRMTENDMKQCLSKNNLLNN